MIIGGTVYDYRWIGLCLSVDWFMISVDWFMIIGGMVNYYRWISL